MVDLPCPPHNKWTFETLEKYLTLRVIALEAVVSEREDRNKERIMSLKEASALALSAAKEALNETKLATAQKFEYVNELRGVVEDQATRFLKIDVYDGKHDAIVSLITSLDKRLTAYEALHVGRTSGIGSVGTVVLGLITAISSFVAIFSVMFHLWTAK